MDEGIKEVLFIFAGVVLKDGSLIVDRGSRHGITVLYVVNVVKDFIPTRALIDFVSALVMQTVSGISIPAVLSPVSITELVEKSYEAVEKV